MSCPEDGELKKFWPRRYYLFSKFDRGVLIDDESWYSVTPEPMAKHIAAKISDRLASADDPLDRVPDGTANVLDAFVGCGGNLIQFGRKCGFCVGVDMDPQKLQYAQHNCNVYSLTEKKEFDLMHSDFLMLQGAEDRIPA